MLRETDSSLSCYNLIEFEIDSLQLRLFHLLNAQSCPLSNLGKSSISHLNRRTYIIHNHLPTEILLFKHTTSPTARQISINTTNNPTITDRRAHSAERQRERQTSPPESNRPHSQPLTATSLSPFTRSLAHKSRGISPVSPPPTIDRQQQQQQQRGQESSERIIHCGQSAVTGRVSRMRERLYKRDNRTHIGCCCVCCVILPPSGYSIFCVYIGGAGEGPEGDASERKISDKGALLADVTLSLSLSLSLDLGLSHCSSAFLWPRGCTPCVRAGGRERGERERERERERAGRPVWVYTQGFPREIA